MGCNRGGYKARADAPQKPVPTQTAERLGFFTMSRLLSGFVAFASGLARSHRSVAMTGSILTHALHTVNTPGKNARRLTARDRPDGFDRHSGPAMFVDQAVRLLHRVGELGVAEPAEEV